MWIEIVKKFLSALKNLVAHAVSFLMGLGNYQHPPKP